MQNTHLLSLSHSRFWLSSNHVLHPSDVLSFSAEQHGGKMIGPLGLSEDVCDSGDCVDLYCGLGQRN